MTDQGSVVTLNTGGQKISINWNLTYNLSNNTKSLTVSAKFENNSGSDWVISTGKTGESRGKKEVLGIVVNNYISENTLDDGYLQIYSEEYFELANGSSVTIGPYNFNNLKNFPNGKVKFGLTANYITTRLNYEEVTNWKNRNDAVINLDGISNGHKKINGEWKDGYFWRKINGVWKRCLIWKKINNVWKKGI